MGAGGNLPNQDLPQLAGALAVNVLLRVRQLQVHVAVNRHERALVLGLAPLEPHGDRLADELLEHRAGVDGHEAHGGGGEEAWKVISGYGVIGRRREW